LAFIEIHCAKTILGANLLYIVNRSSSDSDSGFGSEDKDFELALLRSQDPSEQQSQEVRDTLLALRLSARENSSLEFSYRNLAAQQNSKKSSDDLLLLYDESAGRVKKVRSSQELYDEVLWRQLEQARFS
jgi:hypothetical protein